MGNKLSRRKFKARRESSKRKSKESKRRDSGDTLCSATSSRRSSFRDPEGSEEYEDDEEDDFETLQQEIRAALENDYRRCHVHPPSLPWCRDTGILPKLRSQFFLQDINSPTTPIPPPDCFPLSTSQKKQFTLPTFDGNCRYSTLSDESDLTIDKLLSVPGARAPRRVLILGEPGCGKTTFAFKLAHDWATLLDEDNYLCHFQFVFLVPLRHLQSMSVTQFVEHKVKRLCTDSDNNTDHRLTARMTKYLKTSPNVLFILDGFDELPGIGSSSAHSVRRIINNAELNQATVVITSRHDHGIRPENFGRVLQLKSLSWPQVVDFAASFMTEYKVDAELALQQLYKETYLVGSLLQCPLYLVLFCHLFVLRKTGLPETITELYTEVLNYIVRTTLDVNVNTLLQPNDGTTFKLLSSLGYMCFQKVKEGSLLFSQSSLKELSSDAAIFRLGLFTTIHDLVGTSFETTYQPLHSSFIEFLAAYYLWRKRSNASVFQHHVAELFDGNLSGERLTVTFLAGLLGDDEVELLLRCIPPHYLVGRIGRTCKLVRECAMKNPVNLLTVARHVPECAEVFIKPCVNQLVADALRSRYALPLSSVTVAMSRESVTVIQPFMKPVEIAAVIGAAPNLQDVGLYVTGTDPQVQEFSTTLLALLTVVPPQPTAFTIAFSQLSPKMEIAVKDFITGKQPTNLRIFTWGHENASGSLSVNFMNDGILPSKLQRFTFYRLQKWPKHGVDSNDVTQLLSNVAKCSCLWELTLGGLTWTIATMKLLTKTVLDVHPPALHLPRNNFSIIPDETVRPMVQLADFLVRRSSHLRILDLSHCVMSQEDVATLEDAVVKNRTLAVLSLTKCLSDDGTKLTFHLDTLTRQPRQWERLDLSGWNIIPPLDLKVVTWPKVEVDVLHLDHCCFLIDNLNYDTQSSFIASLVFSWNIFTIACDAAVFLENPTNLWQSCSHLGTLHLCNADAFSFGTKKHFQMLFPLQLRTIYFDLNSRFLEYFSLADWRIYLQDTTSLRRVVVSLADIRGFTERNCHRHFIKILKTVTDNGRLIDMDVDLRESKFSFWPDLYTWAKVVIGRMTNCDSPVSLHLWVANQTSSAFDAFLEKLQKKATTNSLSLTYKYVIQSNSFRMTVTNGGPACMDQGVQKQGVQPLRNSFPLTQPTQPVKKIPRKRSLKKPW